MASRYAKNASTVQSRIQTDNEAMYSAEHQDTNVRSDSDWGAGRIVMICVGIVLALIRAGNGCSTSSTSYEPSYSTPRKFEISPDLYKDLHRFLVARNLDDYLWILASGVGPYEAMSYPESEGTPNEEFVALATEHAPNARKPATELIRLANEAIPKFEETIRALCRH